MWRRRCSQTEMTNARRIAVTERQPTCEWIYRHVASRSHALQLPPVVCLSPSPGKRQIQLACLYDYRVVEWASALAVAVRRNFYALKSPRFASHFPSLHQVVSTTTTAKQPLDTNEFPMKTLIYPSERKGNWLPRQHRIWQNRHIPLTAAHIRQLTTWFTKMLINTLAWK